MDQKVKKKSNKKKLWLAITVILLVASGSLYVTYRHMDSAYKKYSMSSEWDVAISRVYKFLGIRPREGGRPHYGKRFSTENPRESEEGSGKE